MESGKQLGRYEVRSKLGAGGMGEVYLAHDQSLGRDVALKVLPAEFSFDADRLTRFRQEARAVSSLNHPNILTIYEIGESESGWFIATELVRGETLRDLIRREKSLTVLQAVKIAEQIAGALAAAHEAHIIHRDIKPENIMIRQDGYVKILDFGLAKPTQLQTAPEDATLAIAQTTPGLVMGSVRYMSPEQARGKEMDERTDLWSLGVCLFEMLTGKPPFDGETTSDTLAALIYQDVPPIIEFAPDAPAELQRIVRKALRKDKTERYQTAKDFAIDLRTLRDDLEHNARSGEVSSEMRAAASPENQTVMFPAEKQTAAQAIHQTINTGQSAYSQSHETQTVNAGIINPAVNTNKRSRSLVFTAVIGLLILAAASFGVYRWFSAKPDKIAESFRQTQVMRLPSDGKARLPAISPDSKYVAFVSGEVGSRSLVVRQIAADSMITVVAPTGQQFVAVDFAPDGNFIFYVLRDKGGSFGTLFRIPTLGGESKKIIEDVDSRLTFASDGKRLAFLRHTNEGDDLVIVAQSDGSNPQEFTSAKQLGYDYLEGLAWSPDGAKFIVGVGKSSNETFKNTRIAEILFKDKSVKIINDQSWNGTSDFHWLRDGSGLLFLGSESDKAPTQIWSLSYPNGILRRITNDTSQYTFFSQAADDTTLVSIVTNASASLWTAGGGQARELNQLSEDNRRMDGGSGIAEAADGKLFYTRDEENEVNIYKSDADGKNAVKLTGNAKYNLDSAVSPDGKFVVFVSNRGGAWRIWRMDADGQGAVQLSDGENVGDSRPSISADNSTVIFSRQIGNSGRAFIAKVPLAGGVTEKISDNDKNYDAFPRLSPDGKSLAYVSFDAATLGDKQALLVREYSQGALGKVKYSFDYNLIDDFRWSPDGKSLTLQRSEGTPNLWQLALDSKKITPLTAFNSGRIFYFAWSRDGKKIFVVRGNVNNELILIKNLTS